MSSIVTRAYEDVLKRRSKEGSMQQISQPNIPAYFQEETTYVGSKKLLKSIGVAKAKKVTKGKENYFSQQSKIAESRNSGKATTYGNT